MDLGSKQSLGSLVVTVAIAAAAVVVPWKIPMTRRPILFWPIVAIAGGTILWIWAISVEWPSVSPPNIPNVPLPGMPQVQINGPTFIYPPPSSVREEGRTFIPNPSLDRFFEPLEHGATDQAANKALAPYAGNWLVIEGTVMDVHDVHGSFMSVTLQQNKFADPTVVLSFHGEKWKNELTMLNKTDKIEAYCTVGFILNWVLSLDNCELISF